MKTGTAGTSLAALGLLLLAACGGGGGGGGAGPNPGPTPPGPNPTPPGPARGITAIPGIDQIPVNQIKTTNSQMKEMFVISEESDPSTNWHAAKVRKVACNSYTLQCDNSESFHGKHRNADRTITTTTGSAPYTSITDNYVSDHWTWLNSQMDSMANLKIVSHSTSLGNGRVATGATLPGFLVVQAAGNQGVGEDHDPLHSIDPTSSSRIRSAIAANKMLLVAGWSKDGSGNFVRHGESSSCRGAGISEGCLWAQFSFPGVGSGTSLSTPQVAAALASVLAVFPETEHQELAKFAKACAKKTGNGIPVLLATHGGVGVADFTCMGSVTDALASLPTGGSADVAIQGQTVAVEGRRISLSFISPAHFAPGDGRAGLDLAASEGGDALSFTLRFVPTGEGKGVTVGAFEGGGFFASLAAGTREDFFGFARGHEEGVRETRLTAGRKEAFAYVSDVRSEGGASIRSARGRAAGVMLREEFDMGRGVSLAVSVQADRFLGGEAEIGRDGASFGGVRLPPGGWSRQFNVASEIALGGARTLNLSAQLRAPDGGGEETAMAASFDWRF